MSWFNRNRILLGQSFKHKVGTSDFVFVLFLRAVALSIIFLLGSILYFLIRQSGPIFEKDSWHFFLISDWDPNRDLFGALPFLYGTAVTSTIAIVIAVPVAVGTAIFLTELASKKIGKAVGFFIDLLAAIPSVVYGLWGIFVLAPFVRDYIQPTLSKTLGFLTLFQGSPFGIGLLSAGLILSIMILPTICSVCREVFLAVPISLREGAFAMGTTRWEMIRYAVLEAGVPGIISAIVLGLGRAVGETMAVTMLIGNRTLITGSLFSPGASMASVIANEYPEASSTLHLSALTAIGLALLVLSLVINGIARIIVVATSRRFNG